MAISFKLLNFLNVQGFCNTKMTKRLPSDLFLSSSYVEGVPFFNSRHTKEIPFLLTGI